MAAQLPKKTIVRRLGRVEYEPTWRAMMDFTATRGEDTPDEIWLVEHSPVYTLGQAGKPEHLLPLARPGVERENHQLALAT